MRNFKVKCSDIDRSSRSYVLVTSEANQVIASVINRWESFVRLASRAY
jgi:hypothetical protein